MIREPITKSGIDLPLTRRVRRINRTDQCITWEEKNIKAGNRLIYKFSVIFEGQAPEPLKPCYECLFEPLIEISSKKDIFANFELVPSDITRINIIPIVPTQIGGKEGYGDPALIIKNEFGSVFLGTVRQVSFRAETLGYFLSAMHQSDPDKFSDRLATATKKVADTWISDMHRTGIRSDVTPERWGYYDSWAGLGKINCHKINPDEYFIDIKDPFTQDWSLSEEIQKLFWCGYIKGIIEGTTMTKVLDVNVEGSTSRWQAKVRLTTR